MPDCQRQSRHSLQSIYLMIWSRLHVSPSTQHDRRTSVYTTYPTLSFGLFSNLQRQWVHATTTNSIHTALKRWASLLLHVKKKCVLFYLHLFLFHYFLPSYGRFWRALAGCLTCWIRAFELFVFILLRLLLLLLLYLLHFFLFSCKRAMYRLRVFECVTTIYTHSVLFRESAILELIFFLVQTLWPYVFVGIQMHIYDCVNS